MDQINSDILRQFENQGFTINEGIAVDARLVKSANRPISNDQIREFQNKHNTPEGKLDKNGKPIKFTRDLESNWPVKNDKPHYGLKEHASVDINHGFVLATTLTPASVAVIPNNPSKKHTPIKDMQVNPTAIFWPLIKLLTALGEKTQPRKN